MLTITGYSVLVLTSTQAMASKSLFRYVVVDDIIDLSIEPYLFTLADYLNSNCYFAIPCLEKVLVTQRDLGSLFSRLFRIFGYEIPVQIPEEEALYKIMVYVSPSLQFIPHLEIGYIQVRSMCILYEVFL